MIYTVTKLRDFDAVGNYFNIYHKNLLKRISFALHAWKDNQIRSANLNNFDNVILINYCIQFIPFCPHKNFAMARF